MKKKKKELLRRAAIARKSKKIVKRPGFAPLDLPDEIEAVQLKGLQRTTLNEDEAYEIALDNHPDLKAMEQMGTLPKEFLDENDEPWNPRLHLTLHAALEQQLASDEPKGIVDLAVRFEREKRLCAHEIKHAMVAALTEQIWKMQHNNVPFDEKQYFVDIETAYQRWCKVDNEEDNDEDASKSSADVD